MTDELTPVRCGCGEECAKDAQCSERTAKVKERFMLVTGGMGGTLPLCECGFIVSDKWTYCPGCGARLEWEHENL